MSPGRRPEIRAYRGGDESRIVDLFIASYGLPFEKKVWEWRFRNTPDGPGIVSLADVGERLAAHYAVTRVVFSVVGREQCTGLSGTTMTHPDYRGFGLFQHLARNVYARMREEGMTMVWGFPNNLSHRGFVRDLGWKDIYEIPTFRLTLSELRGLPAPAMEAIPLTQFDDRFDTLWQDAKRNHHVIGCRDQRYLTWRYIRNPLDKYRIIGCMVGGVLRGYVVVKRYLEELQIVDLLSADLDPAVLEALVLQVIREGNEEGVASVGMWLNVTDPLHPVLEKLGFRNDAPVTYLGALRLAENAEEESLYNFRNWHITMGDSDVY